MTYPDKFMSTEAESWLVVQQQLAALSAQSTSLNQEELLMVGNDLNPAVGAGGLWGFDALAT